MTMNEFINWLEPDPSEKRGAAICESVKDWTKKKTALEQACRELGSRCSLEAQEQIKQIKKPRR